MCMYQDDRLTGSYKVGYFRYMYILVETRTIIIIIL